ncbi:MAG: EamA/RhaT family transporter [Desulfobacteraceae bacterium]|nr:MAG: EamA/RhaT family transporter [Desulfobacteraceae bacterium]
MQRSTAILLLIGAAVIWSTGGFLIKWVQWPPLAISGMRSAIGGIFLLIVFRPGRFTLNRYMIGGALAYAICVTCFVLSNKLTSAANAILLQYTAPLHVALCGYWFLGERPRRVDWLALVLALFGMVLFFLDDLTLEGLWGNLVALISGLGFAWMALFLRKQKDAAPIHSVILGNLIAAMVALPFMFQSAPSAKGWIGLVLLGLFQVGLAYALFTLAIRHVTALESMLIPTIEPILNPLWVLLLLGEKPGPLALVGGGIIIAAILLRSIEPWLRRRAFAPAVNLEAASRNSKPALNPHDPKR